MAFLEILIDIADMIDSIRFRKRYGIGNIFLDFIAFCCLFASTLCFRQEEIILGTVLCVITLLLFALSIFVYVRSVRKKHSPSSDKRENKE